MKTLMIVNIVGMIIWDGLVVEWRKIKLIAESVLHPMDCADIVMGTAIGDQSRFVDMYTRDRSTPMSDEIYYGDYSITAAYGFEFTNGKTVLMFRKDVKGELSLACKALFYNARYYSNGVGEFSKMSKSTRVKDTANKLGWRSIGVKMKFDENKIDIVAKTTIYKGTKVTATALQFSSK